MLILPPRKHPVLSLVSSGPNFFIELINPLGGGWCAILDVMPSRASRTIGTLALLTCLICPVLETFDNWDPPIQTGNDTEYALVILALSVGAAYSFMHFIFRSPLLALAKSVFVSGGQKPFLSAPSKFTLLLSDAASPPLPLRI